ncbi:MAG: MlaD family protein [Desulfuromonadales bacterium]|jgi:phospholipid/cholesterol/gamma-HCH transport system substrate-binding protein
MGLSTEKKVGIFFLLALVALAVMIELVQGWHPFQVRKAYHALFLSTVGLKVGDPVRMAGVEVGKVRSITLRENQVKVDFDVSEETTIREDSVARVRQINLLGGQFLGLTFGSPQSPVLPPGSSVRTAERVNVDQLITNLDRNQDRVLHALGQMVEETRKPLTQTVNRLESIAAKIDRGEGSLGRLVNDPHLYTEVEKTVAGFNKVVAELENGQGTLGRLLKDPALYEDTRVTVANLRGLTDQVKEGKGTVGRLFTDDRLYTDAADALANFREISAKVNHGEGTLSKLLNDDSLYEETRSTMTHANSIAAKIDQGKGTMGRLVNKDDLYREAKTTLHKVDKTVDGLSDTGPISALGVVLGTLF